MIWLIEMPVLANVEADTEQDAIRKMARVVDLAGLYPYLHESRVRTAFQSDTELADIR